MEKKPGRGKSFHTASASWLPDISGGVRRDESGTDFQLFRGQGPKTSPSKVMVATQSTWALVEEYTELGSRTGTWGVRRSSHSDPKDSTEKVGSDRVLRCREKTLGPSASDPSITQAFPRWECKLTGILQAASEGHRPCEGVRP